MSRVARIALGYKRGQRKEAVVIFPGGQVSIHTGLCRADGKALVHVSVTSDGRHPDEPEWYAVTSGIDDRGCAVRIIQGTLEEVKAGEVA